MNTRFKRIMERKLRASDAREEKAKRKSEAETEVLQRVPALLVTLRHDLGKLPAGIKIEFDNDLALALIRRGRSVALPVASFDEVGEIRIDDEQIQYAGFPVELCPLGSA